jgi:hypothetical protein
VKVFFFFFFCHSARFTDNTRLFSKTIQSKRQKPMFNNIRMTVKNLLADNRGDYTEKSNQLSSAAKVGICAGCVVAAAASANALANSSSNAGNTASQKINAPIGAQAAQADQTNAVYR